MPVRKVRNEMGLLEVRLHAIRYEAHGTSSFEFHALPGKHLTSFASGAHVDVHLPNGLIRSYSLCNLGSERVRYVIAVNKDPASRGGSRYMHESLRVGDVLTIGEPRNNFALIEDAEDSILIAGGIGITPIWCMVQRLEQLGRRWKLYYCARNRRCAAFLHELTALKPAIENCLRFNFDEESGGSKLDLAPVVAEAPAGAHFYCCGPLSMLASFEQATFALPSDRVHVEYFKPKESASTAGGFVVELRKSGLTIAVRPGMTILDAVLGAGVDVPYACTEGICASCETPVIEGIPDHRDLVLSKEERAANRSMMICCSASKSPKLVLDL